VEPGRQEAAVRATVRAWARGGRCALPRAAVCDAGRPRVAQRAAWVLQVWLGCLALWLAEWRVRGQQVQGIRSTAGRLGTGTHGERVGTHRALRSGHLGTHQVFVFVH
jgi:hypothetical protein